MDQQCEILSMQVGMSRKHEFTIVLEWQYSHDENIGGDYAKASIVTDFRYVSRLGCVCGKEVNRTMQGKRELIEEIK